MAGGTGSAKWMTTWWSFRKSWAAGEKRVPGGKAGSALRPSRHSSRNSISVMTIGCNLSLGVPIRRVGHVHEARVPRRTKGNARAPGDEDHIAWPAAHDFGAAGDDQLAFQHHVDFVITQGPGQLARAMLGVEHHVARRHRRAIGGGEHVLQAHLGSGRGKAGAKSLERHPRAMHYFER